MYVLASLANILLHRSGAGLPDFSWYITPKMGKNTKLTTKYSKRTLNTRSGLKTLNGHKIFRNIPFQGVQK
jgi:hypothetical protein